MQMNYSKFSLKELEVLIISTHTSILLQLIIFTVSSEWVGYSPDSSLVHHRATFETKK